MHICYVFKYVFKDNPKEKKEVISSGWLVNGDCDGQSLALNSLQRFF
jgi:hypothetical protein